jgi:hypothetical protein
MSSDIANCYTNSPLNNSEIGSPAINQGTTPTLPYLFMTYVLSLEESQNFLLEL